MSQEPDRRRPAPERTGPAREPRVPMHAFAATMGLIFLLLGVGGFVPGVTSDYDELEFAGPESAAELLGVFKVSVLHNVVHLLFGVGLVAAARYTWARAYLLGGGLANLGVVVFGLVVDHDSDANVLPVNDADTVLHLLLALVMLGLGVLGGRLTRPETVSR